MTGTRGSTASDGGIFVFLEQTDGIMEEVSLEVLGEARRLADRQGVSVTGIVLGENVGGLAKDAASRGADVVLVGESPLLKDYTTEAYLKVMLPNIRDRRPDVVLMGATHNGTALAAGLAVRIGAGLMAHVINLEIESGTGVLLGSVPGFGGSIVAVCKCKGKPQMATVRPGVFKPLPATESNLGVVESIPVDLRSEDVKCRVMQRSVRRSEDISRAERMVVAGLGSKDDLSLPRRLAEAMGASFGVSRPLADKGLAPKGLVVGSTGYSINAKLAIVIGVSGAAHFVSGIRDAETVIAINSDSGAQIFNHADYCVKGDMFKIVPELIAAVGALKAKGA